MFTAEEAKLATETARRDNEYRIRKEVEKEVVYAGNVIRDNANSGMSDCYLNAIAFQYPSEVAKYLKEELGYNVESESTGKYIIVSW